ncbi:MAG: FtsW/RodA/SpoVE family cell cycle protein [Actinobacteria bacterium]|nr:FtsW/RodA/SpoVE family cell cycle protein [Actinomycetota bacterium]NIV90239.1 FtsW/RodA/SpoVE family cell cycle protein [Actinomycetota bacterium]NIW32538.1 FtsW/RodA/SpoVE family cell cycle protein [Actinomycetota bacterium]NIX24751.1 FtsW/RodA/SpoVE family cell cycle protein [Actinomycetota bacterium]
MAVMITMSRVPLRMIVLLSIIAVTVVVGIFRSDVLAEYQRDRLTVFLLDDAAIEDLGSEAARVAYNAEQSQIAIGNGGLTGQGLFRGTQTGSDLVPEQQTDFIFSVAGEELGFRGAGLLLALFAVLLFRIWRTAVRATDGFDRLISIGVMGMFLFQVFQSAGMTMGMMPVTGIPLPLVSYGGSSMLTSMVALGLVLGVHRRRYDYTDRRSA